MDLSELSNAVHLVGTVGNQQIHANNDWR